MRAFFPVLILAFAAAAQAKEALIKGGRSKDHHYEVRILGDENREPSNYIFAIYDARSKKRVLRVEDVGGINNYDDARSFLSARVASRQQIWLSPPDLSWKATNDTASLLTVATACRKVPPCSYPPS